MGLLLVIWFKFMKKLIFIFILVVLTGIGSYQYFYVNGNVYNTLLPANYDSFEKDMFNVLINLKEEEKTLLINYSLRFKNLPTTVSVRDAIIDERNFEKTNEGTFFFSKLKEEDEKSALAQEVFNSAFITFVDFSMDSQSIYIMFSIKNKTQEQIIQIAGDSYFEIGNDRFATGLDFNTTILPTEIVQVVKKFKFSEFPALKDLNKNSNFKLNVRQITFKNGTKLLIK